MDWKTFILSYILSNTVCTIVMALLWLRERDRFAGLGLWLTSFATQFMAIVLYSLRVYLPDFISIMMSDIFVIAGIILLLLGLERFVGKVVTPQRYKLFLWTAFTFVHIYFTFIQPNFTARVINLSLAVIFFCSLCAWLLMRRVSAELRSMTRGVGLIFCAFCLVAGLRIIEVFFVYPGTDFFYSIEMYMNLIFMNQILFIILAFGLLLMVDRRLITDLERKIGRGNDVVNELRRLMQDNAQTYTQLQSELDERKRLVQVLREGQENLQRYFNMGIVGMGIFSPEKRWMEANARLCKMLGYSTGELDELTWSELTHLDDLEEELKLFNDILLNNRDSYQLDKRFIRKDGAVVYTSTYVSCYRNPNGTVPYFLASMVDITERKKGEESMLKLTVFEERQRLARNMHDSVNQSIHGLVLFSETLVSMLDKNNTERARQIASRLQESAFQALKETRLMLYEMLPSDAEKGVNFIQDLESRLLTVERHAGLRAQIIQEGSMDYCPKEWYENLFWITIESLNNALKHAQARKVQIIINCSPQYLKLEIVDDGIGFDPTKMKSGGLGLRNIRERAGLLGGELTIDSSPGVGSKVNFRAQIK